MAIAATMVWRMGPSGNDANGGGFDPGVASPGTDYSQQNSPQVTFNGTTIAATTTGASATITVTGYTVGTQDPGNTLNITGGTNFTVGFYEIISRSGSTWTLDRTCSTGAASGMTGRMGGRWSNNLSPSTSNVRNGANIVVPGNWVYLLGSGMPNPASYTYDYTGVNDITLTPGTTSGNITYAGDPATPSSGFPCIQGYGLILEAAYAVFKNLWLVANGTTFAQYGMVGNNNGNGTVTCIGCILDQFGYDVGASGSGYNNPVNFFNCEISSSVAKRSTNARPGLLSSQGGATYYGNNIHGCIGPGVVLNAGGFMSFNVIAKNGADGLTFTTSLTNTNPTVAHNNTIDNNLGHGVVFSTQKDLLFASVFNNIIANHTQAGKYGMTVGAGTAAANDTIKQFVNYNTYYNNTTNYNAISAGANDTATGTNPFNNEPSDDFTLTSTFYNAGVTPSSNLAQYL